ncbi:MAG: hypothetical protein COU35_01090 [Candidatus Magasanikbacteria bacterium CG10_big_fil_rev_8_21_14_0_10_47_10]|uniref:Uncharacterized protein n=1 Tax=Candidatus Magasanikbacteria bacterium CG10_big_fil_rev_8_21_14_0_10_47_10 TaxID=1974652 RepID=A0A2H0TTK6_9BACT|nr:MAG: hypothetical protein COU35_01090 [Candidatus Magasanikbacteria bacterium CG10_big_fil_rev_8_21_14_0_10_47_10]
MSKLIDALEIVLESAFVAFAHTIIAVVVLVNTILLGMLFYSGDNVNDSRLVVTALHYALYIVAAMFLCFFVVALRGHFSNERV